MTIPPQETAVIEIELPPARAISLDVVDALSLAPVNIDAYWYRSAKTEAIVRKTALTGYCPPSPGSRLTLTAHGDFLAMQIEATGYAPSRKVIDLKAREREVRLFPAAVFDIRTTSFGNALLMRSRWWQEIKVERIDDTGGELVRIAPDLGKGRYAGAAFWVSAYGRYRVCFPPAPEGKQAIDSVEVDVNPLSGRPLVLIDLTGAML
jgi:hypothetical protein